MRRFRDVGWLVFAGVCSVFALFEVLGTLVAIMRRDLFAALTAPFFVLGAYWLATGAWLRTERGQQDLGAPPPEPRRLSTAWTKRYIAVAAACAAASGAALLVQFIQTRQ